ncbi:G-protein-signaling modulator 3 isoform X2 [Gopherus flavomarginatus]|nr:G-protein-signaling modulator 3 isoform X2 [Gopherus flavomarginatus]XP_050775611.1 G-protein-signaling modulator 3 isoform X2 [Gopherus flavomarginatus]
MTSLESEGAAGDNAQPGSPSPASLGGSAPTTDPLMPPDEAVEGRDPRGILAGQDQTSNDPPASDRSDPPTPTEADPLDPFNRERLFDLLFRSQSRRLNEQRCPLPSLRGAPRHDPARPWRSLPGTPTEGLLGGAGKFCSLTSLQAEQFFELVATAQARRLDDQRADFVGDPGAEEGVEEGAKGPPEAPDQEEELYSTILTHQCFRIDSLRTCSRIFPGTEVRLTGLELKTGTTLAFFQSSGTSPDRQEFSKIMANGSAITSANSFSPSEAAHPAPWTCARPAFPNSPESLLSAQRAAHLLPVLRCPVQQAGTCPCL